MAFEDPVLLRGGQPCVERHHVHGLAAPARRLQHLGGVADLAFARQEDQDVPGPLPDQLLAGVDDGLGLVPDDRLALLVGVGLLDQGAVAHLDGVGAPGHLDDRGRGSLPVGEVGGEPLGIDGGGGDDHLQVRTPGQQLTEVAEDEVDVEAALVRLVDDQRVVGTQHPVVLELGEQDAVGHQLDQGVRPRLVGEAHLVADRPAQLDPELLGDPLGDAARRDPARLRVADQPVHPAAELEADLRQLRGLARPGLPRHDHHLVVADRRGDVCPPCGDREHLGIADHGDQRLPASHLLVGATPDPCAPRAGLLPGSAAGTALGLPPGWEWGRGLGRLRCGLGHDPSSLGGAASAAHRSRSRDIGGQISAAVPARYNAAGLPRPPTVCRPVSTSRPGVPVTLRWKLPGSMGRSQTSS